MDLKIGADPELWIFDKKADKIISAAGLFPGTKDEPYKVEHGAIQVDGMAAEYNILPATTAHEFVFHNISVLRSLRDEIRARNPELEFEFRFCPVADFGAEYIAQQSDEARMLGCSPDFNAYEGGAENPVPNADLPFRTASGHIHLGWDADLDINDPDHIEACCMMSKTLDVSVGARMMPVEGPDGHRRRELYGKAGAFRPKSYGVEYRTLSNVWLQTPDHMAWIFLRTRNAFDELIVGYKNYDGYVPDLIHQCINTHDVKTAKMNFGAFNNYLASSVPAVNVDTLDELYDLFSRNKPSDFHNFDEEDDDE